MHLVNLFHSVLLLNNLPFVSKKRIRSNYRVTILIFVLNNKFWAQVAWKRNIKRFWRSPESTVTAYVHVHIGREIQVVVLAVCHQLKTGQTGSHKTDSRIRFRDATAAILLYTLTSRINSLRLFYSFALQIVNAPNSGNRKHQAPRVGVLYLSTPSSKVFISALF